MAFWENVKSRLLLVDLLALLFGISAWISINGLWVELPLMVQRLPEGWNLASYLSIIIQIANIGPITYSGLRWVTGARVSERISIYVLLIFGTVASYLLVRFWDCTTTFSNGEPHSTALFILVFFLSLVDCTSSLLFLPYMAIFRDIYLNSYLVGEGLSGFVPSIVALGQGVGGNPYCKNVSKTDPNTNETYWEMETIVPDPRFPITTFFYFLAAIMTISLLAFTLLDLLPKVKEEHASRHMIIQEGELRAPVPEGFDQDAYSSADEGFETVRHHLQQDTGEGERSQPWLDRRQRNMTLTPEQMNASKWEFFLLMAVEFYICFLSNGALPSIQTYSCLPYGNTVYHLSVVLNSMTNPVMAFVAFFVPCKNLVIILTLTFIGSVLGAFILATALTSPIMLWGQHIGGFCTVASWIIYGGLFSYVKVSVAGICRQKSRSALFCFGAFTQMGSAFGALLMFILVNAYSLFEGYHVNCDDLQHR